MTKQTKKEKKEIKRLKKEKKYDAIYDKYGQKEFIKNVPDKLKKKEIIGLIKERRYVDIYNKYGIKEYKRYIPAMKNMDKYYEIELKEKNLMPFQTNFIKRKLTKAMIKTSIVITSSIPLLGGVIAYTSLEQIEENKKEYKEQLDKYEDSIKKYGQDINELVNKNSLNDLDIFMLVMDDMWENIDGYKTPDKEINGYLGFALNEEKKGVCRNFADDVSRKLNEINPKYNARIITTYASGTLTNMANINQKIIEDNETVYEENTDSQEETQNVSNEKFNKMFGNHALVAVDSHLNGKKITLFLDPTNPSISIAKDGRIVCLNDSNYKNTRSKKYCNLLMECIISGKTAIKNIKLFDNITNEEFETLKNMYGILAQNESLDKVICLRQNQKKDEFMDELDNLVQENNILKNLIIDYDLKDNKNTFKNQDYMEK